MKLQHRRRYGLCACETVRRRPDQLTGFCAFVRLVLPPSKVVEPPLIFHDVSNCTASRTAILTVTFIFFFYLLPSGLKSLRLSFVAIMLFATIGVSAAACWDDVLAKKDRDLLLMRSGAVYQLLDDPRLVAFWFPLARISICDQVGYVGDQATTYYVIRNKNDASDSCGRLRRGSGIRPSPSTSTTSKSSSAFNTAIRPDPSEC
jgi:hypothetical protein